MNRFINRSLQVMLTILCVGVCVVPVCAQRGKGIKNLTKALGKKPPLTGTAPVVRPPVTPRVPPTTAVVGVPHVALPTLERQVVKTLAKAPLTATVPSQFQHLKFLTGPQALQTLRPGWKSELMLSGFTRQQLDLVEQAFKETDQFLFETDEAGNWLSPRFAEWNYTARFAKILTDNAFGEMSLNDGQIKTLFGKFSRLDDVFTRLNLQGFLLTHQGRAPKAGAPGEEGKLARHIKYNIDKRDGRKMNPEVEGYVYGKTPAKLHTPKPSYGPKGRAPRRTPEEVWEEVTLFMREHDGEIPGLNAEDDYERKLRTAWDNIYRNHQTSNDPYVRRLIKLHEETVRERTTDKTPQAWLDIIEPWVLEHERWPSQVIEEEKAMYKGAHKVILNHPEDLASVRLKELKEKYGRNNAPAKTPQEWLDIIQPWVLERQRWPSQYNEEEKTMYKGAGAAMRNDPEDPASVRLKELKEKYGKNNAPANTPQEWLDIIQPWVLERQRWPSTQNEEEKAMYMGANNVMRRNPEDPASVRLKELKEKYGRNHALAKTPQEWLDIIQPWVLEHERWPSTTQNEEEKAMYKGAGAAMRNNPDDPASVRLKELKEKYGNKKSAK